MVNARQWARVAVYGLAVLGVPASAMAQQPSATPDLSIEQRLARLERLLNSQALVEILEQLQRLQRELQELRGESELQNHALQQVKEHQRELYLDLDRRLRRFEASSEAIAASAAASDDLAEPSAPSPDEAVPSAPAAAPTSAPVQVQESYQAAFNLLKEGHYEKAIEALNAFLATYPDGAYADNAQYWLGEAYYVTRQFEAAQQAFQTLQGTYPDSPKVSHAELKLGYIYDELGQADEAKRMLSSLVERYPNTAIERLARERLERIEGEKR